MTSFRQFAANRRNALRSTGPRTESGKQQSRLNAVRHGLTAETVVGSLEDAEDYKAFEEAVTLGYDAHHDGNQDQHCEAVSSNDFADRARRMAYSFLWLASHDAKSLNASVATRRPCGD